MIMMMMMMMMMMKGPGGGKIEIRGGNYKMFANPVYITPGRYIYKKFERFDMHVFSCVFGEKFSESN